MPLTSMPLRLLCTALLLAGVAALECWQKSDRVADAQAQAPAKAVWPMSAPASAVPATLDGGWALQAQGVIPMPEGALAAHASNLLAMPPGHSAALTAFWFAGDRESAPNVQIAASQWDRQRQAWMPPRYVANRHVIGDQLGWGLRRLGNPVAWLDAGGRMHLFVVATGWGGWAASRILHLQQSSVSNRLEELGFDPVRVLPLSWLWNISYLVRNAPLPLADGGMVLPVHFELGVKHASVLRFGPTGDYLGPTALSARHDLLQPALAMQSPTDWLALMRVQRPEGHIAVARTSDGGAHWQDLPDLELRNPDAAVAALGLSPQQMLVAFNPSSTGRSSLALAKSGHGSDWPMVRWVAQGRTTDEYSYPAMVWADESLWISYTADRKHIAWQRLRPVGPLSSPHP